MNETLSEKEFNIFIRQVPRAEVISDLDLKTPEGVRIADEENFGPEEDMDNINCRHLISSQQVNVNEVIKKQD